MAGKRRKAREEALQLLYALEMSQNTVEEVIKDTAIIRPDGSAPEPFTVELLRKSVDVQRDCTEYIEKHALNWELNRIAYVDRLILRLAITEFLCFPDIPPKVTINEFLEIAKLFSTDRSVRFVNGILNAVLDELSSQHLLFKAGRGLETESPPPGKKARTSRNTGKDCAAAAKAGADEVP